MPHTVEGFYRALRVCMGALKGLKVYDRGALQGFQDQDGCSRVRFPGARPPAAPSPPPSVPPAHFPFAQHERCLGEGRPTWMATGRGLPQLGALRGCGLGGVCPRRVVSWRSSPDKDGGWAGFAQHGKGRAGLAQPRWGLGWACPRRGGASSLGKGGCWVGFVQDGWWLGEARPTGVRARRGLPNTGGAGRGSPGGDWGWAGLAQQVAKRDRWVCPRRVVSWRSSPDRGGGEAGCAQHERGGGAGFAWQGWGLGGVCPKQDRFARQNCPKPGRAGKGFARPVWG
jgi:hypothetical protein